MLVRGAWKKEYSDKVGSESGFCEAVEGVGVFVTTNQVPEGSAEVVGVIMRGWVSLRGMHRNMGFVAQE